MVKTDAGCLLYTSPDALTNAAEGAEDHFEDGAKDLQALDFRAQDVLVGIACLLYTSRCV